MSNLILPPDFDSTPWILPLPEIYSFVPYAEHFYGMLNREDNRDITEVEFPQATASYAKSPKEAIAAFEAAKMRYQPGIHEVFAIGRGPLVVGMAAVSSIVGNKYSGINEGWPGVSAYIGNPYRGMGIARALVSNLVEIIDRDFSGHAWTRVADKNTPSLNSIKRTGFKPVKGRGSDVEPGYSLFVYEGSNSPSIETQNDGLVASSPSRDYLS